MNQVARSAKSSRFMKVAVACVAAALGLAALSTAAEARAKVKVQTSSQKAMLKAGGIKVLVSSKKKARVTVSATGKGKAGYFKKVKVTVKGRKTVSLPLTSKGLAALGYCKAVPVRVRAGSGKASRTLKGGGCVNLNLGQNPARCDFLDPTECLQPFANDYFTRSDAKSKTGKRLAIWSEGTPANIEGAHIDPTDMNRADGFSPGNLITLKIPGMDTPAAFENSGIVPITNPGAYDDRNQPVVVLDTKTGKRHPIWAELDSNPTSVDPTPGNPGGINLDPTNTTGVNLIIRPARNFEHGRRYVVILRNLKDAADKAISAPKAFRVYRDRLGTRYPAVENRRPRMESIIQTATKRGKIGRSSLYMAWDFTVASAESVTGRALTIRDDAFERLGDTDLANRTIEGNAPGFAVTSVNNTADPGDLLRRVIGTITVPCYLNSVNCNPGGTFEFDSQGRLTWEDGKTASVPFRCDIPNTATASNPTKTLTYGHGLLGNRSQVSTGYQRALAPIANTTQCAVDWAGFSDEPGDFANVGASLGDMSNFNKLVDRMQQGFVNFMFLQRALIHPQGFASHPAFQDGDGTAAGQPLIDLSDGSATRGQFMGISQGGIMGGALTALSPDVDYGVLGVPGMNYSTLLRRSVDSDEYFKNETFGLYKFYPEFGNRMLLLSLVQLLWDRGEGNGYAHFMTDEPLPNTPPHDVLMRVAFSDHQVANVTAEVQARTIGAKAYAPALQEGRHWAVDPYFGLEKVTEFPFSDGSMMVYYDSGPATYVGTGPTFTGEADRRGQGVAPPPNENVAPRPEWGFGRDPHSDPRRALAGIRHAVEFLNGPALDGEGRGTVRSCLEITGLDGDLSPGLPPRAAGDNHCYANGWNGLAGLTP